VNILSSMVPSGNLGTWRSGVMPQGQIRIRNEDQRHTSFQRGFLQPVIVNQPLRSGNQIDVLLPENYKVLSHATIPTVEDIAEPTFLVVIHGLQFETRSDDELSDFIYNLTQPPTTSGANITPASLQAPLILSSADDFISDAQEFIGTYGADAVLALSETLASVDQSEQRWEFAALLGEDRNPDTEPVRRQVLLDLLTSELAGDRAASASALGRLGDPTVLVELRGQAERERSRIAKSVMIANIRALEKRAALASSAF
jgi:hypothetical protein